MAPGFNNVDSFFRLSPIPPPSACFGDERGDFTVKLGFFGVDVKSKGAWPLPPVELPTARFEGPMEGNWLEEDRLFDEDELAAAASLALVSSAKGLV